MGDWGCPVNNGPKLAVKQPNSQYKKELFIEFSDPHLLKTVPIRMTVVHNFQSSISMAAFCYSLVLCTADECHLIVAITNN